MPKIDEKKLVLILVFLHLAVAVPFALKLNIWTDEASTLYTTQNGFFRAFSNLFTDEKQAPLYFLAMSLWRKVNDSVFFARLFSILCSLSAIVVFSRLAHRIWKEKTAFFITAIFALHPYLFWASLEIRLYSLVILLTCLLFLFFYDGYLDDETVSREDGKARKRAQVFYVLTAITALYTNYYLGFPLVGGFIALLILRRFKAAKTYFYRMIAVGLAILPLFYIISFQFADRVTIFQEQKSLIEGIKILWNHLLTFVLPTEIFTTEESSSVSFVRLWLVRISAVAVVFVLIRNKFENLDRNSIAFGTIAVVCGAFLLFVYFQLGADYVEIRHAAIYYAAIFIFVSAILTRITPPKFWIIFAVLYAVFFSYAVYAIYPNLTKRGDWARVAEYISRNEKPQQPIIIFPNYDALALPVYYKGANKILPDADFFSLQTEAETGSADSFRISIESIVDKIPPDAPEIWLLTSDKCDVKQACAPLEKFVEANYTVTEEKKFYLEKVRLLRKKND